jgi:hypothetical protein
VEQHWPDQLSTKQRLIRLQPCRVLITPSVSQKSRRSAASTTLVLVSAKAHQYRSPPVAITYYECLPMTRSAKSPLRPQPLLSAGRNGRPSSVVAGNSPRRSSSCSGQSGHAAASEGLRLRLVAGLGAWLPCIWDAGAFGNPEIARVAVSSVDFG